MWAVESIVGFLDAVWLIYVDRESVGENCWEGVSVNVNGILGLGLVEREEDGVIVGGVVWLALVYWEWNLR